MGTHEIPGYSVVESERVVAARVFAKGAPRRVHEVRAQRRAEEVTP